MADVERKPIVWLWPGRFVVGLNLVVGDPGLVKSTVTLDIAARVTTGRPWPDAPDSPVEVGSVVLLSDEDDLASVTLPRLEKANANIHKVRSVKMVRHSDGSETLVNLKSDLAQIEQRIQETEPLTGWKPVGSPVG